VNPCSKSESPKLSTWLHEKSDENQAQVDVNLIDDRENRIIDHIERKNAMIALRLQFQSHSFQKRIP
jgi:hypothetical protein